MADERTIMCEGHEVRARKVERAGSTRIGARWVEVGLRRGEIIALRQFDVDHRRRQLRIEKSIVRGIEDVPKGGRGRIVPMTEALASVLAAHRHLRGERVLLQDDGEIVTPKIVRNWMMSAQRRAGLNPTGALHILRHTFCSHLAMRGAPAKAIQKLAGHQNLATTQRYMHVSPAAIDDAIRLLDQPVARLKTVEI